MNNKVGKEIVLDGIRLGKVLAEPTEDSCKGFYLVLLSEEGKRYKEGLVLEEIADSERLKKLCGKYGNNQKNRFYFFSENWSFQFFEGAAKVLTNE